MLAPANAAAVASLLSLLAAGLLAPTTAGSAAPPRPGVVTLDDALTTDNFESGDLCAWPSGVQSCSSPAGFIVRTPPIIVAAGEVTAYCYYFHTPNTSTVAIDRFSSVFPAGVAKVILYATHDDDDAPIARQADGTLSTVDCGFIGPAGPPTWAHWAYAAYEPKAELVFPSDDGAGNPLAYEIPPDTPMFLQVVVGNGTASPISVDATVRAESLPSGGAYTRTDTYQAYLAPFSVPNGGTSTVDEVCNAPAGVEFWRFSMNTHSYTTATQIQDFGVSTQTLFTGSGTGDPSALTYTAPNYFDFDGSWRWSCTIANTSGQSIVPGNDYAYDENCVAIGWFFPATKPLICVSAFGPNPF